MKQSLSLSSAVSHAVSLAFLLAVVTAVGATVGAGLAGCASSGARGTEMTADDDAAMTDAEIASAEVAAAIAELDPDTSSPEALAAAVERQYVVGPAAARKLGYRVDWQHASYGSPLRLVSVSGDSVFTLDERNMLTRIRREDGTRVWRAPVGNPLMRILGIAYSPRLERVFLLTGGDVLVLDAASGAHTAKQKLDKVANTAPVVVGPYLVFGSRNGQVVWHSYLLDSTWAAYQVSPSIQVPPVYADGYIVAVGNDGRVMSLGAESASQMWNRRALAPIVARPAAGNGMVYVASMDQHLRAYELGVDRSPRWEYLTQSSLDDSPVLIGNRVYQHVDADGLVCLDALPIDRPGGVIVWTATEVLGNVLTRLGNDLVTWDADHKKIVSVDARLGPVIETINAPQVDKLMATNVDRGRIYAIGTDGRLVRLVPRS